MNKEIRTDYSEYLNKTNWDYRLDVRYFQCVSGDVLLSNCCKQLNNFKSVNKAFVAIERDAIPNRYHAHCVIKLNDVKFNYKLFELESESWRAKLDAKLEPPKSNMGSCIYACKFMSNNSLFDFITNIEDERTKLKRFKDFVNKCYYARNGDIDKAYFLFEQNLYDTEKWNSENWGIKSEQVKELINFLLKCGSEPLQEILRELIKFVKLNLYGNSKPLEKQDLDIDPPKKILDLITLILKLLSENKCICKDLDLFFNYEVNNSLTSNTA